MTACSLSTDLIRQATDFHGHWCPGLAAGIRAAEWVLREMGKTPDEEIVAVVETDMCGVDAIQFLVGCTFGKGNLIHRDFGKNAFTFYSRRDGKSARLVAKPGFRGDAGAAIGKLHRKMAEEGLSEEEANLLDELRGDVSRHIMASDLNDLFEIKAPPGPAPKKARILESLICDTCGEQVMETRTRRIHGKAMCIPCFLELETR
jgi:formylmethanofuran dehydrogenase subunit E